MGAQRYPLPAEIDVPEFDAEHRDLYRHLTELLHALATGAGGDRLSEILQNLVEHLHDHLAHEERALRLAHTAARRRPQAHPVRGSPV